MLAIHCYLHKQNIAIRVKCFAALLSAGRVGAAQAADPLVDFHPVSILDENTGECNDFGHAAGRHWDTTSRGADGCAAVASGRCVRPGRDEAGGFFLGGGPQFADCGTARRPSYGLWLLCTSPAVRVIRRFCGAGGIRGCSWFAHGTASSNAPALPACPCAARGGRGCGRPVGSAKPQASAQERSSSSQQARIGHKKATRRWLVGQPCLHDLHFDAPPA